MQLHLDLLGGMAGDMFVAAILDLRPDLETGLQAALTLCPRLDGVCAKLVSYNDGIFSGRRFVVERGGNGVEQTRLTPLDVQRHDGHSRDDCRPHDHAPHRHIPHHVEVAWRDVRAALAASSLDPATGRHATGIFALLAEAEANVHGVLPDDVHFHEVGAWDSIADIVSAAYLIQALRITSCTIGPVPLGSGRVATAHGPLPVPAPATALLLEGFSTIDDGIAGERVTPTGAAILHYLCRTSHATSGPRKLAGSGFGFGRRKLPGISNCLRVLAFEDVESGSRSSRIAVLEFEVDDQTGEDLAEGLDRLRAHAGVLDVVQAPVFGKKGRVMAHVRILTRLESLEDVVSSAFDETTTIGIRHRVVDRTELRRELHEVEIGDRKIRLKSAARPGGRTLKAEANDIAEAGDRRSRDEIRRKAESSAEGKAR